MDVGQNIGSSLAYARKLFSDLGRYIILIILSLIPIVNLIVLGYLGRIIQMTPQTDEPPKLERYGDLFIDGLKIVVAEIVYMIIPMIIIIIGAVSLFGGLLQSVTGVSPGVGFALTGFGALLFLVGLIVAIVLAIFLLIGLAHMLKTNNFGKTFAFGEIREIIGRIGWGTYVVWLIVIVIIGIVWGAVVGALNVLVLPLGSIIGVVGGPFFLAFFGRAIGQTYNVGAPDYAKSYPTVTPPPPPSTGYAPPPPTAPAPTPAGFCINCGARLQPQNKFCPSCGQPVK